MPGRVNRGTVVRVNLDPTIGAEMNKTRPCVVVQNDVGNRYSNCTIVVPISECGERNSKPLPVWVFVKKGEGGLSKDSFVTTNHIRTVDEKRFAEILGRLNEETMREVDKALRISLAL
jgi:mRNA interferase MazF